MALQATLILDKKSYDVRELSYSIDKTVDDDLKPSTPAKGGIINFTILSPMDNNLTFHEWVTKNSLLKSGEFVLPLTHGIEHVTKSIFFEKALCVSLQEYYFSGYSKDASQMYMQLKIIAGILKFGNSDKAILTRKELAE